MKKILTLVSIISLILCATAFAESDSDKAVSVVKKAIGQYKASGLEKTLEQLSQPTTDPLYVFVYDLQATMLAHPNNSLIGQNLKDVPDADGKFFRRDIIANATGKGSGWTDYRYKNPKTKEVEHKTTYCEKADDLIFCCGIYKK